MDKLLEYNIITDNVYITVGNRVYRPVVGIPMGTDCEPLLANLFLFFYESKYVKDKLSSNHKQAMLLKYTVRYIDDLLLKRRFLILFYLPQLILKKNYRSSMQTDLPIDMYYI